MALQELSKNVINTMVKLLNNRSICIVLLTVGLCILGRSVMLGQHAFEWAGRVGANAWLYSTDYGSFMPNYDVGMDFSYKYRSPYVVGVRVGLGVDAAAGTYIAGGRNMADLGYRFADSYFVPRSLEADNMEVDVNYGMGSFSETQQQIIVSAPVQLGFFFGDFSLFVGARAGLPVHGCYWQQIRDANMWLYYRDTKVLVGSNQAYYENGDPVIYDPVTTAGNVIRPKPQITEQARRSMPLYYVTAMLDLNYSFVIGENTDCSVGIYAEYDPIGYKPAAVTNPSLMTWEYTQNGVTGTPVFYRAYHSVLESNYAGGATLTAGAAAETTPIVKKYHRAAVGIRVAISLWNVPLEQGGLYRQQERYKHDCLCDFF